MFTFFHFRSTLTNIVTKVYIRVDELLPRVRKAASVRIAAQ